MIVVGHIVVILVALSFFESLLTTFAEFDNILTSPSVKFTRYPDYISRNGILNGTVAWLADKIIEKKMHGFHKSHNK